MKKMIIQGGNRLAGEVTIGGAKNSTVALIPAAILAGHPGCSQSNDYSGVNEC